MLDEDPRGEDAGRVKGRWLLAVGALLSTAAVLLCLVVPLYISDEGVGTTSQTLLEVNGRGVLVPLSVFLGLAVTSYAAPWPRLRAAAALGHGALTILALLSIGTLFLPATLALLGGVVLDARSPTTRPERSEPLVPSS